MIRVLMVCLGNICRSPMAEGVFAHLVKEAGLSDKISVDSAGTGSWHVGETADSRTLAVLKKHKIPYDGRARQLQRADLDNFDYVLAMDADNLAEIQHLADPMRNAAKASQFYKDAHLPEIALFLSYANAAELLTETEVPDPYYNNQFDRVYALVSVGSQALLDHIRKTHTI